MSKIMYKVYKGNVEMFADESFDKAVREFAYQVNLSHGSDHTPSGESLEKIKGLVGNFVKVSHKFQWGNVSIVYTEG